MHEQSVYAVREFGAERKILSSDMVVGDEGGEKKILVAMVLLLCRWFM